MALYERYEHSVVEARRRTLLVIVTVVFAILAVRLFYLQVIKHAHYSNLALSNRMRRERVVPPRGVIKDRNGMKLVVNTPVYEISIKPTKIGGKESRLSLACRWLGIEEAQLRRNVDEWSERYPDGREMAVVTAATKDQIAVLMENRELFDFFKLVMKHRRQYPHGAVASHILGYVGEVTDDDIRRVSSLVPGDIIGRTGIEYRYEQYLRGVDGVRIVQISAEGAYIGELEETIVRNGTEEIVRSRPPIPGNDLYLTIDLNLQRTIEEIFDWERGCVIAMDPANGEILAAVSRPSFNPDIFRTGVSEETWRELHENQANPLFNRSVQAAYPPGSVFKLVTAYAGLTNRVIAPETRFKPCFGSYRFGVRSFGCWKSEGHGSLNLREAIVQSCDVYFYQLGELLTADQFAAAGALFGLGAKSGVDVPGEVAGIIPDRAFYDRRFGKGKWTKGHLLNYSIGQGEILTTPIQLCRLTAALANGGSSVQPHVVKGIVAPDGRTIFQGETAATPIQGVNREMLRLIRRAMEGVISGENGTGRSAFLPQVRIAGKTGTAQNPHGEDHALFIAYAPADDPTIAIAIVMENAGHGGAMAAPVAKKIFAACFPAVAGTEGEGPPLSEVRASARGAAHGSAAARR